MNGGECKSNKNILFYIKVYVNIIVKAFRVSIIPSGMETVNQVNGKGEEEGESQQDKSTAQRDKIINTLLGGKRMAETDQLGERRATDHTNRGTSVDESGNNILMAGVESEGESRYLTGALGIDIGPTIEEEIEHLGLIEQGAPHERRIADG